MQNCIKSKNEMSLKIKYKILQKQLAPNLIKNANIKYC